MCELLPVEKGIQEMVLPMQTSFIESFRGGARRDSILDRPETVRFFFLARRVRLDDRLNAREADIYRLDLGDEGPSWVRWTPGEFRQCLHPFRFELLDTPRAGLHVRIGLISDTDELDEHGYRINQPAFSSSFKIAEDGAFVLTPGFSFSPGYRIDGLDKDIPVLRENLRQRYFLSSADADAILRQCVDGSADGGPVARCPISKPKE